MRGFCQRPNSAIDRTDLRQLLLSNVKRLFYESLGGRFGSNRNYPVWIPDTEIENAEGN